MTSSYHIESERIGFRWWTLEDFPLALALWGDPLVTRLFSKVPLSEETVRERLVAWV